MSENVAGATPALSEADLDVVVEAAHPSRPDRYDLTRQHVERLMADAVAAALAPVERLADEWEREAGKDSEAWRVFGPQTLSVPFAVRSVRAALAESKGGER